MTDTAAIGSLLFEFDSDLPLPWRDSDPLFRGGQADRRIRVKISAIDEFPAQTGTLVYANDDCEFRLTADGREIRDYKALYASDHPHYARSIRQGDSIHIFYKKSTRIWENPNFRIWNILHLENLLLESDALVLHCCWLEHDGQAILLTAPSGTGKTTHGNLWRKCFGSTIVNGDKALLQWANDRWLVRGYPFHGSAAECENKTMPLKAIVILRQGREDRIQRLSPMNRVRLLLSETTVNFFSEDHVNRACDLLTDLIGKADVPMLHCTMDDHAAHTLHDYLYHSTEE